MALGKVATVFALSALLGAAVALDANGTPSPRDARREAPKADVLLDRAALFRPAQVGECGAVRREPVATPAQRAPQRRPHKPAPPNVCIAVWSD